MRLRLTLIAALAMSVAIAVYAVTGPARNADAGAQALRLAAGDLCAVEAARQPVIETLMKTIVTEPAHTALTVVPATFGTREDRVLVVPSHREGAVFRDERERTVIAEATRILRVSPPVLSASTGEVQTTTRYRLENGLLVEEDIALAGSDASDAVLETAASIDAARVSAGLRMVDVKRVETDGDGAKIPARYETYSVRTVEAQPEVISEERPAVTADMPVERVVAPGARIKARAICDPWATPGLGEALGAALVAKGLLEENALSDEMMRALVAWQEGETGLLSRALLLEALPVLLPEVVLPVG